MSETISNNRNLLNPHLFEPLFRQENGGVVGASQGLAQS